jgi:transposase
MLGWDVKDIVKETGVCQSTVYEWQHNLIIYGSIIRPRLRVPGRPYKLTVADKDALLAELLTAGWMYQDEMVHWLWEVRGARVSTSTVSRMLK